MTSDADRKEPMSQTSRRQVEVEPPRTAAIPATHAPQAGEKIDVETIKREHPLLTVLDRYGITTWGSGARRTALCPFHDDRIPSLAVYLDSDRFHCFGCGATGDVIELVKRLEGVGFREAVRRLDIAGNGRSASGATRRASRDGRSTTHISPTALPYPLGRPKPQVRATGEHDTNRHLLDQHSALTNDPPDAYFQFGLSWHPLQLRLALLTVTAAIYRETLLRTPSVVAYVEGRGVPAPLSQAAYLGYADGTSLERFLAQAPALLTCARRCGLIDARGRESLRGRLIIPEMRGGLCVWLHGRALEALPGGSEASKPAQTVRASAPTPAHAVGPKYLGCSLPKPLLGVGLSTLYGDPKHSTPSLSRGPLRQGVIVVEGAFDLFTLLSWHVPYRCVALIGTHTSADQLANLVALAESGPIWLALDADAPGEAAIARLADQLAYYPNGVERLAPPLGAKDFAEVATIPEARQAVLETLRAEVADHAQLVQSRAAGTGVNGFMYPGGSLKLTSSHYHNPRQRDRDIARPKAEKAEPAT